MSDPAYEETEKIIKKIEQRINREYQQAINEIDETLEDYMDRFYKKDQIWQKYVNAVKNTDPAEYKKRLEEYKKWKLSQIAVGQLWEERKQTVAEDLENTYKIAQSIAQSYMPEVYAINHNYGTYDIETQTGKDTGYKLLDGQTVFRLAYGDYLVDAGISFSLYDHMTIERLIRDNPAMLPPPGTRISEKIANGEAFLWNRQKLQSVMMQSILQGESVPEIASRLAETVGDSDRKAAIRNARTMATGAQNAGRVDSYKRALAMGIKVKQQWLAVHDGRTRHSHRQVDYEIRPVGEEFSNGCLYPGDPSAPASEIYNCFTGDVCVSADCEIIRSYKHKYKGVLISIETAGGVKFTCTPNHPILTPCGWVGAGFLNEGDNILVTSIRDVKFSGVNPHINHAFTRFDALHELFTKTGGKRTRSLSVNFHGDRPTTDVEIITQKRFLRGDRNTSFFKSINKILFKNPDKSFMSHCPFMEHFRRICKTPFSLICSFSKSLALFGRGLSHSVIHSFRTITGLDTSVSKHSINNLPATSMLNGKLLDGFSGIVLADNIVNINKIPGCTHVYNLQTEKGYYFVSSSITNNEQKYNGNMVAIAKNCRCTLGGVVDGLTSEADKLQDYSAIGGDYEAWKAGHASYSNPIDQPEKIAAAIRGSYINKYRRMARG